MDQELIKKLLESAARSALTGAGGWLASVGIMQRGDVQTFVGAGMLIAGVVWSLWQKFGQHAVAAALKHVTGKHTTAKAVAAATIVQAGSAVSPDLPKPAQVAAAARV